MTLSISGLPAADDPLADNLKRQAPLGLLGIQPETRRRNRMNGHVSALAPDGFVVSVDQSFGNCPQYIQAREPIFVESDAVPETVEEGALLSARATALVRASDTFFIASASAVTGDDDPRHGVDVSHRGGRQGFVQVVEENGATVLTAPDFRGNNFFNTLGNIASNPKAGLLFLDFTNGDVLQLTGAAEILWEDPAIARFAGAQRLLRFHVTRGRYRRNALPLRWSAAEPASQLAKTGSWEELNP
jgi:predicted pyridoxine 5'-phosphate oxidase superfamily flavin-nucleotide-binding protein